VNDGAARGALRDKELVNPVLTMDPPTYNPPLKDESEATERLAFKETSPAEITTPVNDGAARGAFNPRALVNPVFTIEPFTNKLPLNEASALDTKKVPVKDGDALGAFNPIEFVMVVENAASFPSANANSLRVSNAAGALATSRLISLLTYWVVAICVVLVPDTAVGAKGVPVNVGVSRGAFNPRAELNPVFTIDPPTNKLALKDESEVTERRELKETSPAEITTPVNDGAARGAFNAKALVNPVLTMDPPTNKLALKDESDATRRPAFNETSPAETIKPVNDGAARGAFSAKAFVNPVFTIDPPTNKLALKDESEATERRAFKETSYLNLSVNSVE
jgi:hypothetical protein